MAMIKKPVINNDIINRAKNTISDYDVISSANLETRQHYGQVVKQLLSERGEKESLTEYLISKTDKKNSWFLYRSSIRSQLISMAKKLLNLHSKSIRRRDQSSVDECEKNLLNLMDTFEEVSSHYFLSNKRVVSKRSHMRGLPQNWTELICATVGNRYRLACIVMAITGCRPQELANGVKVHKNGSNIIFTVIGAKVKRNGKIKKADKIIDYYAGQEERQLTFDFDKSNPLINLLITNEPKLQKKNHSMIIKFENKKSFASAVREAGKKLWPNKKKNITPIMFRHQFSSNNKGSGTMDDQDLSAALGHIVTATKKKYGHFNQKRGGFVPVKVLASNPVKISQSIRSTYLNKANQQRTSKRKLH